MQIQSLSKELSATTYPGRGIVLGKSADARCFYIAYFIMGRSENSRNRIFEIDGRGIRTKAFDESKMVDPSFSNPPTAIPHPPGGISLIMTRPAPAKAISSTPTSTTGTPCPLSRESRFP